VIDLTVAQIADIVGGRLADISPEEAAATRVIGTVEFDSRAVTPGGLFEPEPAHDPAASVLEHDIDGSGAAVGAPRAPRPAPGGAPHLPGGGAHGGLHRPAG
jgi:UDP-N-acetylmuramoyl-tripeptide--D-alanyl-D-alanine ligase